MGNKEGRQTTHSTSGRRKPLIKDKITSDENKVLEKGKGRWKDDPTKV